MHIRSLTGWKLVIHTWSVFFSTKKVTPNSSCFLYHYTYNDKLRMLYSTIGIILLKIKKFFDFFFEMTWLKIFSINHSVVCVEALSKDRMKASKLGRHLNSKYPKKHIKLIEFFQRKLNFLHKMQPTFALLTSTNKTALLTSYWGSCYISKISKSHITAEEAVKMLWQEYKWDAWRYSSGFFNMNKYRSFSLQMDFFFVSFVVLR